MNGCRRGVLAALLLVMPAAQASDGQYDCDGDGHDDVAWRHATTGADALWRWGEPGRSVPLTAVRDLHWKIVGEGDFDGDGRADLLWRNLADGRNVIWRSANAATQLRIARVPDVRFVVAGTGDFDGDGRSDILWKHPGYGYSVWPAANVSAAFSVGWIALAAIADLDVDGRDDLLECRIYPVFGFVICYLLPGADWRLSRTWATANFDLAHTKVQAVGDFDGDGGVDLFWRNSSTGENFLWRGGLPMLKLTLVSVRDAAWNVVAFGDYDGDGTTDLFWRHRVRGDASVWPAANGRQYRLLARVPTQWSVAP